MVRWFRNLWRRYPAIGYVLLFIVAASLFTFIQQEATFPDPDTFYHIKAAQLLVTQGAATQFPWLTATTLAHSFTDHHFLYHLALAPFVIVSPLVGMKVATILFAALAIVAFYWLLRQLQARGAWWYALFLLTINPFLFRLNLGKAQALVLIALFIFIFLLAKRWYLALIVWSCLYTWLYAGWPLAAVLAIVYAVVGVGHEHMVAQGRWLSWWRGRSLSHHVLSVGAVCIGLAVGIFFSPYFPHNISFFWQQSFDIAVVNQQKVIGVGSEWYPYMWNNLLTALIPLSALTLVSIVAFGATWRKQPVHSWFFLVVIILFLVATLRSRRYVEYLVPFAVAYCAVTLSAAIALYEKQLAKRLPQRWWPLIPVFLFTLAAPIMAHDINRVYRSFNEGLSFWKYSEASEWLKTHTPAQSVVFHSDWDEFPILFFNNDHNYYIVGLDPTFMYRFDPQLHRRWADITTGKTTTGLSTTIPELFGAQYVFIDRTQNDAFNRNVAADGGFEKVYEDDEAVVYQVR